MHDPYNSARLSVAVVLNMQSKAYAKAQGVPTTWSQEDQGYIARWSQNYW